MPNTDGVHHAVEIRRIAEAADFENAPPEVAELEGRLRAKMSGKD